MSYSARLSPLLQPLAGEEQVERLFSAEADLLAMLHFETQLAAAAAEHGLIPAEAAQKIRAAAELVGREPENFRKAMARDGVVVPELVSRLRAAVGTQHEKSVHFGVTSQDVIDTSLMLRAQQAMAVLKAKLAALAAQIDDLDHRFGAKNLMGRTRMQRALPIRVADRLAAWRAGLAAAARDIAALIFPVQLGGAVGTASDFGSQAGAIQKNLADRLGLACLDYCWQAERSPVITIGNACAGMSGALGKIGIDISLMAQNELAEIKLKGGGFSSIMAHKQNPVRAEMLVALARFSASLLSGLHDARVHEQERSGAAWTLEWLVLPQLIVTAAASGQRCLDLLDLIEELGG